MSSNKTQKWSSSTSLTKILTRIQRTLSFSSKKSQQSLKTSNKKVKPIEPIIKNVNSVPQSAPVVRRQTLQSFNKMQYLQNIKQEIHHSPMIYRNMYVRNYIEEENANDDDDLSRYSLRPNLSLFNVSTEDLHEFDQSIRQQINCLDDVFHSTKIEERY